MKRPLTLLVATLLVAQVAIAPALAIPLVGSDGGPDIQQYNTDGTLSPSYVVELDANSTDSIRDWANASDKRRLIRTSSNDTATVAAPAIQIEGGWGLWAVQNTPLADLNYVEAVHPNIIMSVPDQPGYQAADAFTPPKEGVTSVNDPDYPTDGVAFSDEVNASDLDEARQTIGDNTVSDAANPTGNLAIIDTGANTANGRVFGNGSAGSDIRIVNASKNFVADGQPTVDSDGFDAIADGSGHGTWTAAGAAGNSTYDSLDGVAPNANLLVLKALSDDGSGSMSDIAAAIRYAADNDASVISMSLGSMQRTPVVEDAIAYAYENGVQAVVVATGNSRTTRVAEVASPADYPPVISVSATTTGDGNGSNVEAAYFAQGGPEPSGLTDGDLGGEAGVTADVGAPGFKLTTRVVDDGGSPRNATLSGTSMATPLVAAGVYEAIQHNSTLASANHTAVHDAVRDSATPAENVSTMEVGAGVFDEDNLVAGTYPETSQQEAMDSAAQQRTAYYRAFSDSDERDLIARLFGS